MSVRRVTILGATGSIGRSTLDVLARHPDRYAVEALVAGRDAQALARAARSCRARFAALADASRAAELAEALAGTGVETGAGPSAVDEAVARPADIVVAAVVGVAGLGPTHAALRPGRSIVLANKETLVCAGDAFMRDAGASGCTILPCDSEHNALFQALGGRSARDAEAMILTASGGPFRAWPAPRIAAATREEAAKHPNWSMGAKVTVDSAGLMNKGLELIEAHHLFGLAASRLEVVVHPESIVHGLVRFADGSVVAGLAVPDMRVPIAACLAHPERIASGAARLDLAALGRLTFEPPDRERFPALALAEAALAAGGTAPAVLNAANEVAVEGFLAGGLPFGAIVEIVAEVCGRIAPRAAPASMEEARSVDHDARRVAVEVLRSARSRAR